MRSWQLVHTCMLVNCQLRICLVSYWLKKIYLKNNLVEFISTLLYIICKLTTNLKIKLINALFAF